MASIPLENVYETIHMSPPSERHIYAVAAPAEAHIYTTSTISEPHIYSNVHKSSSASDVKVSTSKTFKKARVLDGAGAPKVAKSSKVKVSDTDRSRIFWSSKPALHTKSTSSEPHIYSKVNKSSSASDVKVSTSKEVLVGAGTSKAAKSSKVEVSDTDRSHVFWSSKPAKCLIVATSCSILLALFSLGIAVSALFIKINLVTPAPTELNQLAWAMQDVFAQLNSTISQCSALNQDVTLAKSQISSFSKNLSLSSTQVRDLKNEAVATLFKIDMLHENMSGIASAQSSFEEIITELYRIKDRPGPPGPKGQKGARGTRGYWGSRGYPGPRGPKGETGVNGTSGLPGLNGSKGQKGSRGLYGINGQKGARGLTGQKGDSGPKGAPGLPGIGSKGAKGQRGPSGYGVKGDRGPQGPPGLQGIGAKGQKGVRGSNGVKGAKGDRGPRGYPETYH